MANKKKTLKTYKTAAGAQQYGDDKAWGKVTSKISKDFVELSIEDFKKKYGVDAFKAYRKATAGDYAAKAKSYKEKGLSDRNVKQVEDYEKKWVAKSNSSGYNKGGYAKCGASNPGTKKFSCGGMVHKKK